MRSRSAAAYERVDNVNGSGGNVVFPFRPFSLSKVPLFDFFPVDLDLCGPQPSSLPSSCPLDGVKDSKGSILHTTSIYMLDHSNSIPVVIRHSM